MTAPCPQCARLERYLEDAKAKGETYWKLVKAIEAERDGARHALEDRDAMHAEQVREIEAKRMRLQAEVEQLKKCAMVTDESWRQLQADNARLRQAVERIHAACDDATDGFDRWGTIKRTCQQVLNGSGAAEKGPEYEPWKELGISETAYWKRRYLEARMQLGDE